MVIVASARAISDFRVSQVAGPLKVTGISLNISFIIINCRQYYNDEMKYGIGSVPLFTLD